MRSLAIVPVSSSTAFKQHHQHRGADFDAAQHQRAVARRSGASRSRVASTQMRVASTIEQPRLALAVGGRLADQPADHVAVRPNAFLCCEQIPASLRPTDLMRTSNSGH